MTDACSPGEHSHSDRPNFTMEDYLQMCRDGEATFSISEAARVMGQSRAYVYRCLLFASIPEDEFEEVLDAVHKDGPASMTAVADEIKRRTGKAKTYEVRCPHCDGLLYTRER